MTSVLPRFALFPLVLVSFAPLAAESLDSPLTLQSPGGRVEGVFNVGENGEPAFRVSFRGQTVTSVTLGLEFAGSGALSHGLTLVDAKRSTRDETYAIAVGKASSARDHHRELTVTLEEQAAPRRRLELVFRAYDDGVAFRYRVPRQDGITEFVLTGERTQLRFPANPEIRALHLNRFTTPYEKYYETSRVSEISPQALLGLPALVEPPADAAERAWIAVTEAHLSDYAGLYLSGVAGEPGALRARLSPLPGREDGARVIGTAPHASPWRVLMIADDPGRLIESNLVFHLNPPAAIEDTSWIRPGKTTFPWWNGYVLGDVDFEPGVNTATMKHYINFCAEQGIPYHSLDGFDIAWYGGPIGPRGPTDVTTAAPSIDLPGVLEHARKRGVRLRVWVHWRALKPQIDEAFRKYAAWGIEGVMVDFMDRDDQEMVRFYEEMARKAARHRLTLTFHGCYKPTGMERTWPNVLSYEAALNQEYNKWDGGGSRGTPPEHNLDVAFIRLLAGPVDYHQGGMRSVLPDNYRHRNRAPPVQGTRGHQLAMYVVYQNHLSMVADYPAAYRGQDGLEFLVDVPANWDETRVLHAEPGKCIVIARRKDAAWYLGGMTASDPRELDLPLEFLGDGAFHAELYLDDPSRGPTALTKTERRITAADMLRVPLPPAGGFVARIASNG